MEGERNLVRNNANASPTKEELKKDIDAKIVKPVAKGTKKKNSIGKEIASEFIRNDFKDILRFGLMEVAVPGVKDVVFEWGQRILEMWLYRDDEGPRYRNRNGKAGAPKSYGSYFKGDPTFGNVMNKPVSNRDRVAQTFSSVEFESRRGAVAVYQDLLGILYEYGVVTVAQFYQLASCQYEYTDRDWGWNELPNHIEPRRAVGGKFVLELPKPHYLK